MSVFEKLFIAVAVSFVIGFTSSMVYAGGDDTTSASGYHDNDENNNTSASGYQDTDTENDDVVSTNALVEQDEIEVIGAGNTMVTTTTYANQEEGSLSSGGILLGRSIGTVSGDTGTPTGAVSEGDRLGFIVGRGYDGSSWHNGAALTIKVDGPVTSGSVPARFNIETGTTYEDRQDRLVVKSDGKIGIGTTTPGYDLDVVGNINFTGSLYQNGSLFSSGDGNGGTTSVWETFGTDIYYNDGNVGIGTTEPEAKLHVTGAVSAGEQNLLILEHGNTGVYTEKVSILFGTDSGGGFQAAARIKAIGIAANDADLAFFTNDVDEQMRITNDGNVGIGTMSPKGKLDVNGTIYHRGIALHADYVFETNYALESIREHADFMWKNKRLKAIPKTKVDENGQEIVEIGLHRKGIVEELEKAHIYISQLEKRVSKLAALRGENKKMKEHNKSLEVRLTRLETLLNIK